MSAVIPRHRVNVLTGIKSARLIEDPLEYASLIKKAKRPLLVVGPLLLKSLPDGKLLLEYALDIAKALVFQYVRQPRLEERSWSWESSQIAFTIPSR